MEIPFQYGKIVQRNAFIDRSQDIKRLHNNFTSGTHTILLSPRRWGKSSLVFKAAKSITRKDKSIKVCFLDLYKIRTPGEFYKIYAEGIINSTSGKLQDTMRLIRSFFSYVIPKISIAPDPQSEITLSMDWQKVEKNPQEILALSEHLAKKNKIKLIVCIDEFQNIGQFDHPEAFQKSLRATWQYHQHVVYCLYGSKRHKLLELFSNSQMPFYKFGDLFFLEKIERKHWIRYLQNQFSHTGKDIDASTAGLLIDLVDRHSYYVQQLAQLVWFRTKKKCTPEIVQDALLNLQLQLSLVFQQITDSLSKKQINLLQAIAAQVENLSAKSTIQKYNLGTSSTVVKAKKALEEKEIIDLLGNTLTINDPLYMHWLVNFYFNNR